jgi:sulfur-carrier protein
MKVNVLIFGPLKDVTGTSSCEIADVPDTDALIEKLNALFPGLSEKRYLVAVEKEITHGNTKLNDNFKIALLPPYSGG